MIKPVNGHLLIEPVVTESFMAQQQGTFQEIGVVIAVDEALNGATRITGSTAVYEHGHLGIIKTGDRVYFDAWLAAKYPTGKGDEFYWLVKWEDVRAIENAES